MQEIDNLIEEVEELLEAYDERPSDRKDLKKELIEKRSDAVSWKEDYEEQLKAAEKEERDLLDALDDIANDPESGKSIPKEKIESIMGASTKIQEAIDMMEDVIDSIDTALSGKRIFDKWNCFQNIRNLMATKDIKIGQIEAAAGVRVGYMSRLEKPDNTSEPGIMFIATAAKMLGVTLDELVYSRAGQMSEDEEYIRDFLRDIIEDTDKHDIHWEKERDDILCKVYDLYNNPPSHPLLFADDGQLDEDNMPYLVKYGSLFYKESNVYVESAYSAELPETNSLVYLVWCFTDKNDKYIPDKKFFEVYVTDEEGNANPICNTLQAASPICVAVETLYKIAMSDAVHSYIAPETKNIINNYRKRRNNKNS